MAAIAGGTDDAVWANGAAEAAMADGTDRAGKTSKVAGPTGQLCQVQLGPQ